tara:strand:+ start:875 stop:1408 length:534 start_codon:yes stop_codon:yes gene_type:complete
MGRNNKVLILTGPGGSGKSTIAELLVKKCNFVLLDGDHTDTEFFPKGGQWMPGNSEKLCLAHNKILKMTKNLFNKGENIVIDYIIFGHYLEFFEKFSKEFGKNLVIRVLFPSQKELITRDKDRECWTTGIERIKAVRKEFQAIRSKIGKDKFIDTSNQTPEETFNKYFKNFKSIQSE